MSTVGWGCFSFRLGFRGSYWFAVFRPAFSSPCSFYPYYLAEFSLLGRVNGLYLRDRRMDCSRRFWTTWSSFRPMCIVPHTAGCAYFGQMAPIETINKQEKKNKEHKEQQPKKEKKDHNSLTRTISLTPPAIEISTPGKSSRDPPPPPLLPLDGSCLGE